VIALALVVALGTLGVGLAATFALRLLPSVRLQLAGFGLLAVVLPLLAVLLSGWVMFHMGDDVKILAVAAAAASAAVAAAVALATSIGRRIDRLRAASTRLAAGDLAARAPEGGPRELAELGRSFNAMADSIEGLFDARRELVAAASHDLRTPVASINAMLEAIEDGLADVDEYLGPLQEQTRRLAMLVEDLFELARIDAGALAYELQEVELGPLVESCLRGLEAEARTRNVTLERWFADAGAEARCAPEQVERVLLNLLTNALHHTPSDGTVAVTLASTAERVHVTVEDTGEGITPEAARRMFDRFWRSDSARRTHAGGAGLGLAIARGLVEAQGGTIWAEPRDSGGARVSFTLPAAGAR
jgi:signal transduction histidine kinase